MRIDRQDNDSYTPRRNYLTLNKETIKMKHSKTFSKLIITLLATFSIFSSNATIVLFETQFGDIEVNLYDQDTPQTVANFLQYVDDGNGISAYSNVIIHRSVDNFIIQGGGFVYNGGSSLNDQDLPLDNIAANPAVVNEPVFSNVRGTIAMAKLSNNVNSATNQWFFNLANNAANLDDQNGGFTVFGEVVESDLAKLDQIAAVQKYDKGGTYTSLPLDNYDGTSVPDNSNLIVITSIQISDGAIDTAAGLNPALSTAPTPTPTPPAQPDSSGGGGALLGDLFFILLLMRARKSHK